jgi:hypothetical protein
LRAYYRLSDVQDATANNLDLTDLNTVGFVAGLFGNAVDLNGTDEALVRENHIFSAAQLANLSISFWVKLEAEIGSGTYRFVEWHTDKVNVADGMLQAIDYEYNGGTRRLKVTNYLDTVPVEEYYTITMGTANWYHFVYVKSGTTNLKFYINKAEVIDQTGTGADHGGDASYTYDTAIGTNRNASGSWSNCLIDDLAVFERVLTPTEISNLYTGNWSNHNPLFFSGGVTIG